MYLYSIQAFEVNIAFLFVTILFHCKQFLLISRFFTVQNKGILMSGGAYPYTRHLHRASIRISLNPGEKHENRIHF